MPRQFHGWPLRPPNPGNRPQFSLVIAVTSPQCRFTFNMVDLTERLYREAYDLEESSEQRRIAPGRVPATTRISRAPSVVYRVADVAAARVPADAVASRDQNGVAVGADALVGRAASSSGAPLPDDLLARFEYSLGADLSSVRIHTGAESATAASAVGAKAYTVGQDIHFGEGKYVPSDPFGLHLLAHEVAHTVQQQGAAAVRQHKLEVSAPGDGAEIEADRAADAMVAGQRIDVAGGSRGLDRKLMRVPVSTDKEKAAKIAAFTSKAQIVSSRASISHAAITTAVTTSLATITTVESRYEQVNATYKIAFDNVQKTMKAAGKEFTDSDNIKNIVLGAMAGVAAGLIIEPALVAVGAAKIAAAVVSNLISSGGGFLAGAATAPTSSRMDAVAGPTAASPDAMKLAAVQKILKLAKEVAALGASTEPLVAIVTGAGKALVELKAQESDKGSMSMPEVEQAMAALEKADEGSVQASSAVAKLNAAVTNIDITSMAECTLSNAITMEQELWLQWMASGLFSPGHDPEGGNDSSRNQQEIAGNNAIRARMKAIGLTGGKDSRLQTTDTRETIQAGRDLGVAAQQVGKTGRVSNGGVKPYGLVAVNGAGEFPSKSMSGNLEAGAAVVVVGYSSTHVSGGPGYNDELHVYLEVQPA
jgi:hypothetical protein